MANGDSGLLVLGSAQAPGRLRTALAATAERTAGGDHELEFLDLAEKRVGFADGRDPATLDDDTAAVLAAVAAAEPVIFATPTYRGSMTAALKNLFDLLPVPALAGKTVGLVTMGGSPHHYLGADRHLRDVLAFFGALVLPVTVYLTNDQFTDGEPNERATAELDELIASAFALARAREGAPPLGPTPFAARAIRG
ncbi:MAG: NAD(P)H-dependent oxidoreductase [Actinobacteria bacterium]|nr:NAD(P)H-dependent oxidoreductase [Actinomycetota bacterium]